MKPTRKKVSELKEKVQLIFDECLNSMSSPNAAIRGHTTYADAIVDAGRTIRGWRNSCAFCNDARLFANVDRDLYKIFNRFRGEFNRRIRSYGMRDKQRVLGMFPLVDCNKDDNGAIRRLLDADWMCL